MGDITPYRLFFIIYHGYWDSSTVDVGVGGEGVERGAMVRVSVKGNE